MCPHATGRATLLWVLRQGSDLRTRHTILPVRDGHNLGGRTRGGHAERNYCILRTQLNAGDTAARTALRTNLSRIEGQKFRFLGD